jgi:hypothetical protein
MRTIRSSRHGKVRVAAVLAVLFLAGSALFGAVLLEPDPGDPSVQPVAAPAPALAQTLPVQRGQNQRIDDLATTPLTHLPRRADHDLTSIRLTGIVVEPARRTAIFAVQGEKPLVLSEGETVNVWHLDGIAPHEVRLTGPAGTTILELESDPNLVRPAPWRGNSAKPPR